MYMAACSPTVTIEFPVDQGTSWSFSSPFAKEMTGLGVRYYDAGEFAPAKSSYPGTWFRPSFLHELLHAFGLNHTSSAYAMMNHRGDDDGFPWGNRADADAVRPLPDDVRLLRASYPASGTRWDVDALNMWYVVTSASKGGAADQVKLCTPSLGNVVPVLVGLGRPVRHRRPRRRIDQRVFRRHPLHPLRAEQLFDGQRAA